MEPHALAEIEGDGVLLDLPGLRERGPDVQPPVELRQRVVRVLLPPVRRAGRHAVRRHRYRVGLEPERERSAPTRPRRRERPLRGSGRSARQRSCGDRARTDHSGLGEQVATTEPAPVRGLARLFGHVVPSFSRSNRPSAGRRLPLTPLRRLSGREVCVILHARDRTPPFQETIQESIVGSTIGWVDVKSAGARALAPPRTCAGFVAVSRRSRSGRPSSRSRALRRRSP